MSHTPLTPEETRNELLDQLLAFLLLTQGTHDTIISWRVAWEYLDSRKDITPEERLGIRP